MSSLSPRRWLGGYVALAVGGGLAVAVAGASGAGPSPGYGARIDVDATLPPPPLPGSAAAAADRAAIAAASPGGPGWRQAQSQVDTTSSAITRQIGCALGRELTPATTPATLRLIANVRADVRVASEAAKSRYRRDRPFVGAAEWATCDWHSLGVLGRWTGGALSHSYPSGHAAYGRAWGRVLAEAVPARAGAINAWGEALGDNRVACRVHWPSDVAGGRRLADAVVAALATRPAFRADLAAARAELSKGPPASGCGRAGNP